MKKISLLVVGLLCSTTLVFSQGSYVRLNVGYGFPMGSQQIGSNSTYNSNTEVETEEGVYGSYGSGIMINSAYGLSFKGIVGIDLELGYFNGKKYEATYKEDPGTNHSTSNSKVTGISFTPSITITAQEGTIIPYTRFGPVVGSYKIKSNLDFNLGDDQVEIGEEYTGNMALGFKGCIGVIFNPASKFQFFSEINFVSMSYSPTKGELTKYSLNGVDYLDDVPSEYKNYAFKDKVTYDDSENGDTLKEKYPMGSISLQAGIRMKLY